MELSPAQIVREWKAGKFRPVYYFFGEEAAAKSEATQFLKSLLKPDVFNLNEYGADANSKIEEILSTALTPPMFSEKRLVIVKNSKLGVEARKKLAEYLASPLASTILILFSDERKPDIRDILAASVTAQEGIVVFRPMNKEEALSRLQDAAKNSGVQLGTDAAECMVDEAGTDWGILGPELSKLLLFVRGKKQIERQDVLACLGYRQTMNPFDFARTLQTRDKLQSLKIVKRLLSEGSDPFWLLYQISGTINKQLKAKRMMKAGIAETQIFRELRLNSYYDKNFLRWASRLRDQDLRADIKACIETETALKSKTWLDSTIELENLVAGICRDYAFAVPAA